MKLQALLCVFKGL